MSSWTRYLVAASLLLTSACSSPTPGGAVAFRPAVASPTHAIDRVALRAQLAEHRAQQIAHLDAYGKAGQFPVNTLFAPSLHMFRDAQGRLCAVANLIETDGRQDLVESTVFFQNDLAISDVRDGNMMDWVQGSGLTQEELVGIQLPAPYVGNRAPVQPVKRAFNVAAASPPPKELPMNALVAKHVFEVEAELRANTETSLDVAVERYVAAHAQS